MRWKTFLAAALATCTFSTSSHSAQTRIIGGSEINISGAPWQVAILSDSSDLYTGQYCGGTLVHPRWVITAAHCMTDEVDGTLTTTDAADVHIAAGMADLITPEASTQLRDVSQVIVHPSYDPDTTDYDIALLELAEPIDLETCGSACAAVDILTPAQLNLLVPDTDALISGWGNTSKDGELYATKLQSATIQVQNCADSSYPANAISPYMFCAGVDGNVDSCQGDSGGPLVVNNADDSAKLLAGIVSWGNGCALPGYPGIYTNVAKFYRWIYSQTAGECCSVNNYAPVFSAVSDQTMFVKTLKVIPLIATDADDDALTFNVISCPEELICNILDSNLYIKSTHNNSGVLSVAIGVSDIMDASDTITINFNLEIPNAVPVITPIDNQSMATKQTLTLTLAASDADGDVLTYSASCSTNINCEITGNILTLSSNNGLIGESLVSVTVTDNKGAEASTEFTLTITQAIEEASSSKSGGSLSWMFMLLLLPLLARKKAC